ncbi:MAG: DNA polymerase III subunit delta [Smithellaceae bacterium]|jgi:DNA polymerase-3 subunit delta
MAMEKIFADLKKGVVAPCYLLYGEEEYQIGAALDKILDIIMPAADRDFGLFYLEGENADSDTLVNHLLTPSLAGARKVVVVKNTTIFQSRENLAELIDKIRRNIEENPTKAAKSFRTFLKLSGFSLEDLLDDGWKKITDEEWNRIVEGDTGEDREKWLPRVLALLSGRELSEESGTDDTEKLGEILQKGLAAGNCLILTADAVDKRKKIFKIISTLGAVLYFGKARSEAVQKENLIKAAQKLLKNYGKKLSEAAWTLLGQKTGWELRHSLAELEKLIFFVGERPLIEEKDVEEVVGLTREESIFALTSALSEKNQLAALAALKTLLDQGLHHLMILTMLVREIRFLLQARILADEGKIPAGKKNAEYGWFQKNVIPRLKDIGKSLAEFDGLLFSQHPFVIYNIWRNCGNFSSPTLINFLDTLLEIDRAFKSTAAEPRFLLENFLIKACAKD